MTPVEVQDILVDEIKLIFRDYAYKNREGKRVPLNVYAQDVPIIQTPPPIADYTNDSEYTEYEEEDEDDNIPVPYIIVRISSGGYDGKNDDSNNELNFVIIVNIFEDEIPNNNGYRDVLNIMQKIYERFAKQPDLRKIARFNGKWEFALQEDNYYPFHIGACNMTFDIPAIREEVYYSDYC